jgi:para-aminobenzoate synthetase/4-amino-4-deoxychorismate lyase
MKGTVKRGLLLADDERNKRWLKNCKKIQAENVMIVDLLRNDLGKISNKVTVPCLFEVEKYRTLYQMTSTIEAELKDNVGIKDIFTALFPCGSVTGAPKIKTIEIIKRLEKEPRGIYTGAIGFVSPQKEACFNVAIRTIFVKNGKGELGIGGGIVYDSLERSEYEEAFIKAKFLTQRCPVFSLIETILWKEDRGYFLLDLHLKRLKKSCEYFSIPLNFKKVRKELEKTAEGLRGKKFKVRVLVNTEGKIALDSTPLEELATPVKVKVSSKTIDPHNLFLYHKTTQRSFYDEERKVAQAEGFFEVIFLNIYGELTEGAVTNIFVLNREGLYTPPLHCGLLAGVLREYLLREKKLTEKVIRLKDIMEADKVYVGNSVRGLMEAEIPLVNLEKKSKIKTHI